MKSKVNIGDIFIVENWQYTVTRRSANLPDSMVICKMEHMSEMLKPREDAVWICDLIKHRSMNQ